MTQATLSTARRVRFDNAWWLLKQSMKCLFGRRDSSVIASITYFKPLPKIIKDLDFVSQATSEGVMTGPAPIIAHATQTLLNQSVKMLASAAGVRVEICEADHDHAAEGPRVH